MAKNRIRFMSLHAALLATDNDNVQIQEGGVSFGPGGVLTLWVWVPTVGFAAPQFWDFDRFRFSIYHLPPPIFAILVHRSKKWKLVM